MNPKNKPKEVRFYNHQDNKINSSYVQMGEFIFKISSISAIGPSGKLYSSSVDKDRSKFDLVCDGIEYIIISDEKMSDKIRQSIIKETFPEQNKNKEKKFI